MSKKDFDIRIDFESRPLFKGKKLDLDDLDDTFKKIRDKFK